MQMMNIILTTLVSGFAFTLMSCATSAPVADAPYFVYFNSPKVTHTVQPWPLEEKAEKSFTLRSADLDALFVAPLATGKPEDTQLFYPSDHKLKGLLRIEREELTTKIVQPEPSASAVYIDRRGGVWRDGMKVLVPQERIESVVRQLDLEQANHPSRK